jgi:hypothetical protein
MGLKLLSSWHIMVKVRFSVTVCGSYLHVLVEEDPLDRELQSKELARIMAAAYPRPAIFLGYVVTKPQAERRESIITLSFDLSFKCSTSIAAPYKILVEDGLMHDIDWEDQDRW